MSGIYIPGMEMPDSCLLCPLMNNQWQTCKLLGDDMDVPLATRRSDCPLVLVPPHGRLIDADALIVELMDRGVEGLQTDDWYEIQQVVADAPTIIPAEEGE